MTNIIDKRISSNSFYKNIFNSKPKQKSEVTKEDSEYFRPKECKGWEDGITVNDLFENPIKEDKEMFEEKWVNKIHSGEKNENEYRNYLIKRGYSKEHSEWIISYAIKNVTRQKLWANENEKVGKEASILVNASIVLAILKELFDFDSIAGILKLPLDFLYGLSRGIRNYKQYYLYDRPDDDANCNRYQKDMYGNKLAGSIGSLSMIFERKINPYLYPVVELLEDKVKLPFKRLLSLPTNLWWRVRMPAHINQPFLTDFINYMFHFLPSIFGRNKSKKIIEEVKKRGNISLDYVLERHYKNAGIKNKEEETIKNLVKQTIKHTKELFNRDLEIQKEAANKLGATVAPVLGIYGTFAMGVGSVGSVVLRSEKQEKFFDFLTQTSIVSQQFIYFPKMVIPMFSKAKELDLFVNKSEIKKNYSKEQIKNVNELAKKFKRLSYVGGITLILNVINNFLKLVDKENHIFKKVANVIDEVSFNLILKFFSQRRHLIGQGFKLTNVEFYP